MNALLGCEKNIERKPKRAQGRTAAQGQKLKERVLYSTLFFHLLLLRLFHSVSFNRSFKSSSTLKSIILQVCCMFMCSPFHVHKFCLLYTSHDTYLMLPFFFIFTLPLQQQQQAETWRDKETLCDTGDSPTDSRLHKNLQGWESTSVTIATPSGNLWLNPQRI